jgi:hypothetical protein
MIDPYTHQEIEQPRDFKRMIKRIAIIVGSMLLIAGITAGGLYLWHRQVLINEVKTELKKVPDLMNTARKKDGVYPTTITAKQLPPQTKVTFVGLGSFDGTIYCVTGTSKQDSSIVYYIDSSNKSKDPLPGSCTNAPNLPKPLVPHELAVGSTAVDQIYLSWSSATYAGSYTVECSTNAGFTGSVASRTFQALTGACEGLNSSTLYYIRVRANNTSTAGDWSPSIQATTNKASIAPSALTGTRVSSNEVGYSWNAVPGAKSYIVELSSDINFMKDVVDQTVSASKTSATFSGLQPFTAYFIHVKAVTADFDASRAAFSDEIQVRTLK